MQRTLIVIRERPILDLLDLSLVVIRKRPVTLGLAALFGIAPFFVFNALVFQNVGEEALPFFAVVLWMLEAPLALAPLTLVLGGLMFGQKPTIVKLMGQLLRSAFGLLVVHGFLRYLLFFFIPNRMAFANPILLLERDRWWKLLGRGSDLSSGRNGELFLLWLFQLILTFAFAMIFYAGMNRLNQIFLNETLTFSFPTTWDLGSWWFQLPIWMVTTFYAVLRFLIYIDQRIRLEGWEVELRLREVGEALGESRRW